MTLRQITNVGVILMTKFVRLKTYSSHLELIRFNERFLRAFASKSIK